MDITNEELLRLSTKIEREGKAFYTELAEHIREPDVKEFLETMAKEEATHEIQFAKMLSEKGERPFGWESNASLRALIDAQYQTDIFPNLDELFDQMPRFQGIQKAIGFALEAEKVSAEFYGLMQEVCTDIKTKTLLVLLERAEQDHLDRIEQLKERYLTQSPDESSL